MKKKTKKIIEYVIVAFLIIGGIVPLVMVLVDEKSACTLQVDAQQETLTIDAGFYGNFSLSIQDAIITYEDEIVQVVPEREIYVKNNRTSVAGIAGVSAFPDFPVYLGIRNKSIPYILLIIGENYYLVNEKTVEKTDTLYAQLIAIQTG